MSESNNNTPMRITQLEEATAYEDGMYYAVSKAGSGTKKIPCDLTAKKSDLDYALGLFENNGNEQLFNAFEVVAYIKNITVNSNKVLVSSNYQNMIVCKMSPISDTLYNKLFVEDNSLAELKFAVCDTLKTNVNDTLDKKNDGVVSTYNRGTISTASLEYSSDFYFYVFYKKSNNEYADLRDKIVVSTGNYATSYKGYYKTVEESVNGDVLVNKGYLDELGVTDLKTCIASGWYGFGGAYASSISDLPSGWGSNAGMLVVFSKTLGSGNTFYVQELSNTNGDKWQRVLYGNPISVFHDWTNFNKQSTTFECNGDLESLSITDLKTCIKSGWYGCGSGYIGNITDLPTGFNSSVDLLVRTPVYRVHDRFFSMQELSDTNGNTWRRILLASSSSSPYSVFVDWTKINDFTNLYGKNVAILGDSISTNGTDGDFPNVPEITVQAADVGVELKAYLTYYDVQGGLSLGGHTFTSDEIGTEVTFTPTSGDVGKKIGLPYNYNPSSTIVWWEVMKDYFGFNPIPVCWSGSSITSHESSGAQYKTAHAWHDAQIRKCGIRTPGTMNRTAPDVVFIYRGTNDFSHSPYTLLTDNYFDNYNWTYPENDSVSGGYGYKEGLCLTIKKIRDAYPNAKIFLCTLNVFKRINYSHFPTNNGINSLPQYNDAIREVADFMGCGVINFDQDGITFENCYSQGYITDSATIPTHPSNKGHKAMGLKAIADIKAQYSNMT